MKRNNNTILRVSLTELFLFVGAYFFSSWLYRLAIWISYEGYSREDRPYFDLIGWFNGVGLHHLMMMLITGLIWIAVFRWFSEWKLWKRLMSHVFFLPLFLFVAHKGYYFVCDLLGIWRFDNSGQVWDIYIPMLMYFIQFGIFHAYEYYHVNQKKLQEELELKNALLKNELSALKAQLNPHFLYNVFNSISASIPQELESTRETIAELSDLFRYQLKASKEELVTVEEELNFIKQYLELERKRFEDRLKVSYVVEDELLQEKIPSMILQPIIENSVKHGISEKVNGGEIHLRIERMAESIYFEIADTGKGVKDKSNLLSNGVGLSNTQKTFRENVSFMLKNRG